MTYNDSNAPNKQLCFLRSEQSVEECLRNPSVIHFDPGNERHSREDCAPASRYSHQCRDKKMRSFASVPCYPPDSMLLARG